MPQKEYSNHRGGSGDFHRKRRPSKPRTVHENHDYLELHDSDHSSDDSGSAHHYDKRSHHSGSTKRSGSDGRMEKSTTSSVGSSAHRSRVRFAAPADSSEITRISSKAGFLKKQADNEQGAWNKYYFVLRPMTYLYYYNSPNDEKPRGIIDLEYLTDIKRNVDCVQRAVGGSERCFRVAGALPKSQRDKTDKPKLRPLYLDTETEAEAREWMDAIRHHRFQGNQQRQVQALTIQLAEAEERIAKLTDDARTAMICAESVRDKAKRLVNRLRGIENESETSKDSMESFSFDDSDFHSSFHYGDIKTTIKDLESLVDDFQTEMANQSQMIEEMREREILLERKLREATKFVAPERNIEQLQLRSAAEKMGEQPQDDDNEEEDRDGLGELGMVETRKGRSKTSADMRGLLMKTTSFLSKKTGEDRDPNASSPKQLPSVLEDPTAPGATKKTSGFVNPFRKRAATSVTASASDTNMPSPTIQPHERPSSGVYPPGYKLPSGWTRRESRAHPGEFYYAHVSGWTTWELPTEGEIVYDENADSDDDGTGEFYGGPVIGSLGAARKAVEQAEEDAAVTDGKRPKLKKGWKFKFPKTFGKAASADPAPVAPAAAQDSDMIVEHDDGRVEF